MRKTATLIKPKVDKRPPKTRILETRKEIVIAQLEQRLANCVDRDEINYSAPLDLMVVIKRWLTKAGIRYKKGYADTNITIMLHSRIVKPPKKVWKKVYAK